jgi:hypothetical protein
MCKGIKHEFRATSRKTHIGKFLSIIDYLRFKNDMERSECIDYECRRFSIPRVLRYIIDAFRSKNEV